jgi:predicted dehydrogenase
MGAVSIVGTGFVADLYMRSLKTFPGIGIKSVYDRNPHRLLQFCRYWGLKGSASLDELLETSAEDDVILNLTNPSEHFGVSRTCLNAGRHVYSEKPLSIDMADAYTLHALAAEKRVLLASAPCSILGECAQTLWRAVRDEVAGKSLLAYAELDDDFVSQAPYRKWISESGAPWPHDDEFQVGCTLEHAGYYLTWLMAIFGSVKTVVAASAELIDNKAAEKRTAPDFSVATMFFESGLVARLTCSIIAPHDHRLRIVGSRGVLELEESWNNDAKVSFRKRFVIKRRLVNSPIAKRIRLRGPTHPKVKRRGAATMNFALGPAEMLSAISEGRPCRLPADLALHLNEVTLAIQNAGATTGAQTMQTRCSPIEPMTWAIKNPK